MTEQTIPQAWADQPQLDGLDLVDKASLVGVPFRITAAWFTVNTRGVAFVYVNAEDRDGNPFAFNDSGSGVRSQLIEYLDGIGHADAPDTATEDNPLTFSLVIMRGLRVSEFEVTDDQGRRKHARTYYLTANGLPKGASAPQNGRTSAPAARGRGRART